MAPHDKENPTYTNWALLTLSGNTTVLRLHQKDFNYQLQRNFNTLTDSSSLRLTISSITYTPTILVNATLNGSQEKQGDLISLLTEFARENKTLVTFSEDRFQVVDVLPSSGIMAPKLMFPSPSLVSTIIYAGVWALLVLFLFVCSMTLVWHYFITKRTTGTSSKTNSSNAMLEQPENYAPFHQPIYQFEPSPTRYYHGFTTGLHQNLHPEDAFNLNTHVDAPLALLEEEDGLNSYEKLKQAERKESPRNSMKTKPDKIRLLNFHRHSGGGFLPMHSVFGATSSDYTSSSTQAQTNAKQWEDLNPLSNQLELTQEQIYKDIEPILKNLGLSVAPSRW
ncbi:uncharacterized protein LOC131878200 [Tigriopus californicus]|uniref:uncharacterized protein LOC131878200 n=1 Tax=Tigriopus californicus TaxID=6832 RepID=UPI0027D9EB0C|nr:uncharacterized protein LOC131878200 [Tigriopus californicus]